MKKSLIKFNKKIILISGTAIVAIAGISGAFIYKFTQPNFGFKPVIFNYSAYLAPNLQQEIEQKFSYRVFNNLPEFKQQLIDGKIIGGISSGNQIAFLIKNNLIKPINFNWFFGTQNFTYDAAWFENQYTQTTWNYMQQYSSYLNNGNINGPIQMWQYTVPYFMQSKVVAYNVARLDQNKLSLTQKENGLFGLDVKGVNNPTLTNLSYTQILNTLAQYGAQTFAFNNVFRQNLAIGALNDVSIPMDQKGNVTEENYQSLVNNFVDVVKNGTGYNVNNSAHISFPGSDAKILNDLVDTKSNLSVGVMYNGDALGAYLPYYQFNNDYGYKNIKFVRSENRLSLMDGFVLGANISNPNLEKELLNSFYNTAYKGSFNLSSIDVNNLSVNNYNQWIQTNAYENFNYIVYTPTTKLEYQLVYNFYFKNYIKQINEPISAGGSDANINFTPQQMEQFLTYTKDLISIPDIYPPTNTLWNTILILPIPDIVNSNALIYYNSKIEG